MIDTHKPPRPPSKDVALVAAQARAAARKNPAQTGAVSLH
ncbi:Uncharacterised protein [Vibrio cholerae]|nr:Uncharacterised protein [Vibrio cholerae]